MKSLNDLAKRSELSLDRLVRIEEYILNTGYMSPEKVRAELEWFVIDLGIDAYYFRTTSDTEIAKHLIALSASELITHHGGEGGGIQLMSEREDHAVYIIEDQPEKMLELEYRIEAKYGKYHLESYITRETHRGKPLRFYVLTRPQFKNVPKGAIPRTFEEAASDVFLAQAVPETITRYKSLWEEMNGRETPCVSVSYKNETDETRIMIGLKGREYWEIFTTFSHLLQTYGLKVRRKYAEPFCDDKRIASFYFPRLPEETIEGLKRDLNVTLMIPRGPIGDLFREGACSPQQTMYAISAASFTHQFISLLTEEYLSLQRALKDQPEARGIVDNLKLRLIKDTYSTPRIAATVRNHLQIVKLLYQHFEARFNGSDEETLKNLEEQISRSIEREVPYNKDREICKFFLQFNKAVDRTNFYNLEKSCTVYRIHPEVLDPVDYPERPYGLFFLVGHDFLGFHMRFREIARGGIRIVRSRSVDVYAHNIDTIFTENYNLAWTQQRKNKDIPEGGAKGTILLNLESQNMAERAFKDYVDGLLDLLLAKDASGETIVREILFLGPDEGTAGLMDWASLHAEKRGYPFWKAFSTGKAPEQGGVPHDLYGMTTQGVHQYVLGVLEKMGLKEEEITKIQTGGPDGDLGSNEIRFSRDRTLAVVDGSGVLYDPKGINRKELMRLVEKRVMVEEFDRSKLSKDGFFVSINDRDVQLPNGEIIANGEEFRNIFHLTNYARADLFVPCGGRPGAINIGNWKMLLDSEGKPKFRFIVEGANLFITEDARLRLEERGVVVLKDASTNKGGVTSSSFEVYASLAFTDDEFDQHLRVQDGNNPLFRQAYVDAIIQRIKENARLEFELLWKEWKQTGTPLTVLSNRVSEKINKITDAVRESSLVQNSKIVQKVIEIYTLAPLLELLGVERILERVPSPYIAAITATKIATDYVYSRGLQANEVDFADFISALKG
ncbi:MAG TPA: NAD-glutamate dehydrogenase [Spirochaetales bacterium]|nr:NAD-glutamate dehydrogenase [Spirochaetales bacterium]HOV39436.1 NAD-glutamate dehydrogenase [Spirochaetales bacterium]